MTNLDPRQTPPTTIEPGSPSRVKRNVLICLGVVLAGSVAFYGVAPAIAHVFPQITSVAAPSGAAAGIPAPEPTVDPTLFPKYYADSVALLKKGGGVLKAVLIPGLDGTFNGGDLLPSDRIFNAEAAGTNLASQALTHNPDTGQVLSDNTSSTTTVEGLLELASSESGTVSEPLLITDVIQISPNTFQRITGGKEIYVITNGLISQIGSSDVPVRWQTDILYGLNQTSLDTFNEVVNGYAVANYLVGVPTGSGPHASFFRG